MTCLQFSLHRQVATELGQIGRQEIIVDFSLSLRSMIAQ